MAVKGVETALVLFSVLMLWNGAAAQSGCTSTLITLYPCLSYVQGSSSTPSSSCCSQLSSIVQTQPRCLCLLLNGSGSSLGITVNKTLALALPGACNVQTPPVSKCYGQSAAAASAPANSALIPGPGTAPVGSPVVSSADSSDDTSTNMVSQGTVPMTGVSSDGITIKSTLHIVVFVIFVVSSASAAIGL